MTIEFESSEQFEKFLVDVIDAAEARAMRTCYETLEKVIPRNDVPAEFIPGIQLSVEILKETTKKASEGNSEFANRLINSISTFKKGIQADMKGN